MLLTSQPQLFILLLLWILKNSTKTFVHPLPLIPYLLNNCWTQVIPNGPLMKVAYFNLTIRYLYQAFQTSDLRSFSTNMIMFLPDISCRTRPSKQFTKNMCGLISKPLFKISANPVLLAKGPKHLGISLTDFWSNSNFQETLEFNFYELHWIFTKLFRPYHTPHSSWLTF